MKRRDFLASVAALAMSPAVRIAPVGDGAVVLEKAIDVPWGPAGLTGETWYHLFQIAETPHGPFAVPSMDNLHRFSFSRDIDGTALKALGHVRRVGSVLTDEDGHIRPFEVVGDWFTFDEPVVAKGPSLPPGITVTTRAWHDRRRPDARNPPIRRLTGFG